MSSKTIKGPDAKVAGKPTKKNLSKGVSFRDSVQMVFDEAETKLSTRGETRNISGLDIPDYAYTMEGAHVYKTFMPIIYIKFMRLLAIDRSRQMGEQNLNMMTDYEDDLIDLINYCAFEHVLVGKDK